MLNRCSLKSPSLPLFGILKPRYSGWAFRHAMEQHWLISFYSTMHISGLFFFKDALWQHPTKVQFTQLDYSSFLIPQDFPFCQKLSKSLSREFSPLLLPEPLISSGGDYCTTEHTHTCKTGAQSLTCNFASGFINPEWRPALALQHAQTCLVNTLKSGGLVSRKAEAGSNHPASFERLGLQLP